MWRFFRNIVQLMLSPGCGWEDLATARSAQSASSSQNFLLPLFGVSGLAQFMQLAYNHEASPVDVAISSVIVFVSLFAGWQIAQIAFRYALGRFIPLSSSTVASQVVAYGMALMSLAYMIPPLLPMSLGLQLILPLCASMIVWKASATLGIAQAHEGMYLVLVALSIFLPPLLIQLLFTAVS